MSVAADIYEGLGPHREDDVSGELEDFVAALAGPLEALNSILSETDTHIPWEVALDVDEAPQEVLPWLAQWVGVRPVKGQPTEDLRGAIRTPDGFARGSLSALLAKAQRTLTGTQRLIVRERTPGPYNLYVRSLVTETPDSAATLAALISQKPAGIVLDYAAAAGMTYIDVAAEWSTFADLEAEGMTYDELESMLP
jgi:hypothetical protein